MWWEVKRHHSLLWVPVSDMWDMGSINQKAAEDSGDLLVTKRQVWPPPLPPPSNIQLVNNYSNILFSRVGNPVLYILNSTCLKMKLFLHTRGDSTVWQQKLQLESSFHPCGWLGLIYLLNQVRTKHSVQSSNINNKPVKPPVEISFLIFICMVCSSYQIL